MRFRLNLLFSFFLLSIFVIVSPTALAGPLVAVDPGHGGWDSGAVGPGGLTEKSVNLDIGMRLKALLQAGGYRPLMTRETDIALGPDLVSDLGGRTAIANNAGADIFISIHNNASTSPGAGGTETYYYLSPYTGVYDPDSRQLAKYIQLEIVSQIKRYDRGAKTANFYVLRNTTMPAVLVEGLFISNPTEEAMLANPIIRQAIAQGILNGIVDYFSNSNYWYIRKAIPGGFEAQSSWSTQWGKAGDIPLTGNFDGDLYDDIAIYRPTGSGWFVKRSNGSGFDAGTSWSTSWGNSGTEKPLVGDFDGDGKSDIAIYRYGSHPNWFFKLSTGTGFAPQSYPLSWGNAGGDTPIAGDFNGDGKSDIAIYRKGSYPNWFIRLSSSTGPGTVSWGQVSALSWGNAGGDTPIVGNFNGDKFGANSIDDIGIYRTGSYPNWFFLRTKADGTGFMAPQNTWSVNWGNAGGDIPIVGDFGGDGKTDIGIFRISGYPNWFTNNANGSGFDQQTDTSSSWGNFNTDRPIIGDFSGDGWDDLGIYRRY